MIDMMKASRLFAASLVAVAMLLQQYQASASLALLLGGPNILMELFDSETCEPETSMYTYGDYMLFSLVCTPGIMMNEEILHVSFKGDPIELGDSFSFQASCPKGEFLWTNDPPAEGNLLAKCNKKQKLSDVCIGVYDSSTSWTGSVKIRCIPEVCSPRPSLNEKQCKQRMDLCNPLGFPMKWNGKGCKRKGKLIGDGGCQCLGYCGYKCKQACERDPICAWKGEFGMCTVRGMELPGIPITKCLYAGPPETPVRRVLSEDEEVKYRGIASRIFKSMRQKQNVDA